MKRIALFFILALTSVFATSALGASKDKETKKILDATAQHITKSGGISIKFTATTLLGKTNQGSISGTMDIQDKKFFMQTSEMTTWFDGKTQWSMQTGDTDVNVTEPTGTELQAMNPYAFVDIYKHGFNYKMKQGSLINGKQGYKIYLTADNAKQEIREIYLEVDNQLNPVRVSMRQGKKQWVRIVVNSFTTGRKFADSLFTFPKDKYPDADIIDLR